MGIVLTILAFYIDDQIINYDRIIYIYIFVYILSRILELYSYPDTVQT